MNILKQLIIPLLLVVTLAICISGCVVIFHVKDSVEQLREDDKKIMDELRSNLNAPDTIPVLTDSLAFYKTDKRFVDVGNKKIWFTFHRFFFKRANYTDSLSSGFSILVADFDKKGIIIENQDNVTLSASNFGEPTKKWKAKLNLVTLKKSTYSDFSDEGLRIKTYIRSNKF